jgi:hypothetical protein
VDDPTPGAGPTVLKLILRVMGTSSLFALIFVAAPHSWMRPIHAWVGLGKMPDTPIVWYLARSTSAFYALTGGLFWVVSFDLPRFRPVLIYLSAGVIVLGVSLLILDRAEGLPRAWALWEGPFTIVIGAVMLVLSRRIGSR